MRLGLTSALAVVMAIIGVASAADAAGRVRHAPLKDCWRYNGPWGFTATFGAPPQSSAVGIATIDLSLWAFPI